MAQTTLDKVNGAHSLPLMLREAGLTHAEYGRLILALERGHDHADPDKYVVRSPEWERVCRTRIDLARVKGDANDAAAGLWRHGPVTDAEVAHYQAVSEADSEAGS